MKKLKLIVAVINMVINVLLAVFLYGIIVQNAIILYIGFMVMAVLAAVVGYRVTKNYIK